MAGKFYFSSWKKARYTNWVNFVFLRIYDFDLFRDKRCEQKRWR